MSAGPATQNPGARKRWSRRWDKLSLYFPVLLMAFVALGTYWLVRTTPGIEKSRADAPVQHEPDYYLRDFSVITTDANDRLKNEVFGVEGRHYPDTETLEIDLARVRLYDANRQVTVVEGARALSNADGSEIQLFGNATVSRAAGIGANGRPQPAMKLSSDFLQVYTQTERVSTPKPVVLIRGRDRFTADSLDYDNLSQLADLKGRVKGVLEPGASAQ